MGNLHQTPPRGHSTPLLTDPDRLVVPIPVHVITRHSSLPSTPIPSLEYDRSCLQEPFLGGGQSNFLGIQRLEKRKTSATDPHLVDNDKIQKSLKRLVDSAGNIPSTVMLTMEVEATDLIYEVDSLMSRMEKKFCV